MTATGSTQHEAARDLATASSAELSALAWSYVPGGISSARRRTDPPISIRSASGAELEDRDGNRWLDFHQAYGAIILGHSFPAVTARVSAEIRERVLFGLGITEGEVELARRLVELIPCAEQVVLANTGSEATYNAIRLARGITRREKILKFDGCYHGGHDYVLRNRRTLSDDTALEPEYGGVLPAATDSVLVARYNDLDDVEAVLLGSPEQVAAIIVEPIAHNAPNILPADGFLEGLRAICDREGILLIFDEVITGFRHHAGGYQAICGVTPDLATVGKAMANGYPIAAVVGPRRHMERFATHPDGDVFLGGTYNGNATAVAAALATIEVLTQEPVYEHVFRLGRRMRDGLAAIARDRGVEAAVTGYGSLYTLVPGTGSIRSNDDVAAADAGLFVRFKQALLRHGIVEMPVPFVRAQVGFSHTDADVDRALEAADASLAQAVAS